MGAGIRTIVESHVCLQRQHDELKLPGPRGQVLESVDFVSLARHHSQLLRMRRKLLRACDRKATQQRSVRMIAGMGSLAALSEARFSANTSRS